MRSTIFAISTLLGLAHFTAAQSLAGIPTCTTDTLRSHTAYVVFSRRKLTVCAIQVPSAVSQAASHRSATSTLNVCWASPLHPPYLQAACYNTQTAHTHMRNVMLTRDFVARYLFFVKLHHRHLMLRGERMQSRGSERDPYLRAHRL